MGKAHQPGRQQIVDDAGVAHHHDDRPWSDLLVTLDDESKPEHRAQRLEQGGGPPPLERPGELDGSPATGTRQPGRTEPDQPEVSEARNTQPNTASRVNLQRAFVGPRIDRR